MHQFHGRRTMVALGLVGALLAPVVPAVAQTAADNTKVNTRDRATAAVTADQQVENGRDREITRKIRQALVGDKTLSTYAHNVKIVARDGQVTNQISIAPDKGATKHKESDMTNKKTAVFGLYPTVDRAEGSVDELVSAGFSNADVSVLMADRQGARDFAHEKNTKAPEGTTTGVAAGGTIGGTLGLLAGIGALAIPGVGPFIAAGPIMGALAGLGVGGAVGGLVGALVGMGIPEYEAKRYEGRLKEGGVLLSVHCDTSEQVTRAKEILTRTGAHDISSTGEETVGAAAAVRRDRVN